MYANDNHGQLIYLRSYYTSYFMAYDSAYNAPDLLVYGEYFGDPVGADGNTWYTYAVKNQTGYKVRVHYYEYFQYKNGFKPVFIFGTNIHGQDIFACLAYAGRLSFLLAFAVSFINFVIGACYGAIEGYYGGVTDIIMQRISEILGSVPFVVAATLFQLHLKEKAGVLGCLLFAFVLTGWIGMSNRVRMQFYRFKGHEYVLAARTLGAKDSRLIFKHIFPNSLGTIITGSVLAIPGVIFSESMLSYLGIINLEASSMTSIGTMLSNGQGYLGSFPHIILFPALFISILEISFNLFGNGLRDAFNPSLRGADE
jgi:oligopeptide transport system permease protein